METQTRYRDGLHVRATDASLESLFPIVYDELRRLAAARLAKEPPGRSLQTTDLVHEAYLRLQNGGRGVWNGRAHFFSAAAEAMRRILVDRARSENSLKRGGKANRTSLSTIIAPHNAPSIDVLALHDALEELQTFSERHARLVNLRYFAGLTIVECAELLGVSKSTIDNDWAYAKAWLKVHLEDRRDRDGKEPG